MTKAHYSTGTFLVTTLVGVCAVSLFMPLLTAEQSVSVMDVVFGKIAVGLILFGKINIYGLFSTLLTVLPLFIMSITILIPVDRIKKYVVCCFLSLIQIAGYFAVFIVISNALQEVKVGMGIVLGEISLVGIVLVSLIFTKTDPISKRHKDLVWYNGFNKIILLISLPASVVSIVILCTLTEMFLSFSTLTSIAVFALFIMMLICGIVSVFASYAKYKPGILYYINALLTAVSIMCFVAQSGTVVIVVGAVISMIFIKFWVSLGTIAYKNFLK